MKRNNKKGFTIVELVIVIAVIAILSAVLIPTFGGITEKAQKSAAQQVAVNVYKEVQADDLYDDGLQNNSIMDDETYELPENVVEYSAEDDEVKFSYAHTNGYTATLEDGEWTVAKTPAQGE